MDIMVHIEDDLVEHVTADDNSLSFGEHVATSSFKIAARRLGITTLYVGLFLDSFSAVIFLFKNKTSESRFFLIGQRKTTIRR